MSGGRWYIDNSRLANSPSRRHGISQDKEEMYLQQTANFIQEMGRKLSLPLLCINTAVLYTQRFYIFHSIAKFEKYLLGASALFLAAKVEEHPRKLEHLCQVARNLGLFRREVKDSEYIEDLLLNENILMQTLGFDLQVQHPHQHVLRLCQLIQAPKNLSQTSYILATYCLHLTKMCLLYKPAIIASVCIHMASKMNGWEIPVSKEGKQWYKYGDPALTIEMLEQLFDDFIDILKKCPEKCKHKTLKANHENLLKKLTVDKTGLPVVSPSTPVKEAPLKLPPPPQSETSSHKFARLLQEGIDNFTMCLDNSSAANDETINWENDEIYKQSPSSSNKSMTEKLLPPVTPCTAQATSSSNYRKSTDATASSVEGVSHMVSALPERKELSNLYGAQANAKETNKPPENSAAGNPRVSLLKSNVRLSNSRSLNGPTHSKSALMSHLTKTDTSNSLDMNKNKTKNQSISSSQESSPALNFSKLTNNNHKSNYSTPRPSNLMQPSTTGLKITIPRSRIQGFESLLPPRSATPAELKTDKADRGSTPLTASLGTEERSVKRFKPN